MPSEGWTELSVAVQLSQDLYHQEDEGNGWVQHNLLSGRQRTPVLLKFPSVKLCREITTYTSQYLDVYL